MKKTFFTILLLLAVASLGLAFPQAPQAKTKNPTYMTPSSESDLPQAKTKNGNPEAKTKTTLMTPAPESKVPAAPAPTTPPASTPLLASADAITNKFNISPQCGAAIFSIITSPEFLKCIPIPAFIPLIPIVSDPDLLKKLKSDPAGTFKTIEPALVKFSDGFCPAPKCSDKGVSGAIKILSDGCKDDLKTNQLIQIVFGATVFYSPLHDTVCFKNKKTKDYCWDESAKTIFSLPKSPIKIVDGGLIDSIAVADPDKVCTTCNKDIVNTFENFLKDNDLAKQVLASLGVTDKMLELANVGIAVKCGISFEDGKVPHKH